MQAQVGYTAYLGWARALKALAVRTVRESCIQPCFERRKLAQAVSGQNKRLVRKLDSPMGCIALLVEGRSVLLLTHLHT